PAHLMRHTTKGGGSLSRRHGDLQLLVSDDGAHFQYSIAHPESVRRAWIEVLDVPALLDSRTVAIQQKGEFSWEWNQSAVNLYEHEDDILTLSLWDPDGETWICEGTVISSHPGGEVSEITLGGRTKFSPEPRLGTSLVRVRQGRPSFRAEHSHCPDSLAQPGPKVSLFCRRPDKGFSWHCSRKDCFP